MGGPRWTEQEDSIVRALYPAHGAAWDGWSRLLPGKTQRQVTYRANRMGVYSRAGLRHKRPRWSAAEDAALRDAVAAGLRTRREMGGAVPGKGADAAYQRARKLGLIGGVASPAAATGPWPTPAERRALAAALRRMVRDGADMTDRGWVAVRLAREAGVEASAARAWMEAEWGRKR